MRAKAKEINIWSFYNAPEELLKEIREWREFSSGDDSSVVLKNEQTGESVTVSHIGSWDDDRVEIKSDAAGELFDSVVGRVVRVLSERSGYLKIIRSPYNEERLFIPKFRRN